MLYKITTLIFSTFFVLTSAIAIAQVFPSNVSNKSDSLRGNLNSPFRTCYDINFYHLNLKINPDDRTIKGSNQFHLTANTDFNQLQFDLFDNLNIEKIIYQDKSLNYKRIYNAVFVTFPSIIKKGSRDSFTVFYSGKPIVANNPPWDGGFIFSQHDNGKPWIATACQGLGASMWWPNKDQQDDKVDSMLISISVPKDIMNVSNGRLKKITTLDDGYEQYDWFVKNPINNYNVAVNAANYTHISDSYKGKKGSLSLDYYVLPEHEKQAIPHFNDNVKKMLEAFEYWFGPYPFYEDGYKLIETPHLGMEHQSAIAYGNNFKKGYLGKDLSNSNWGLKWDFIIIHESGHEWFGNNITAKDIADMWIHESFTSYSESLFVEYWYGKTAGGEYVRGLRRNILNDMPIIGKYGVNQEGSGDMYYKGSNMLHTIRTIINNDKKWLEIIRGLNSKFRLKTITSLDIINYFNHKSEQDFSKIFDQYLSYKDIPVLEIKEEKDTFLYRWNCDVKDFDMQITVKTTGSNNRILHPTAQWKSLKTKKFEVDSNYYINVKKI
jgi:aminopeptidase N